MENEHEHRDLERTAPQLMRIAKRDPFVVPDRFFSRFPQEVKERIREEEHQPRWSVLPRPRLALSFAFGSLLVLLFAYIMLPEAPLESERSLVANTYTVEDLLLMEDTELLLAEVSADEDIPISGIMNSDLQAGNVLTFLDLDGAYLDELLAEQ